MRETQSSTEIIPRNLHDQLTEMFGDQWVDFEEARQLYLDLKNSEMWP